MAEQNAALPNLACPTLLQVPDYNGSHAEYKSLLRALRLQFFSNPGIFATNVAKITYAISFMKTGFTAQWANEQTDILLTPNAIVPTWDTFMNSMNDAFDDPQDARTALAELQSLKQNKLTAVELFVKFESLMRRAKLNKTHHSDILITLLETNLNQPIIDQIYSVDVLPVGYMAWKVKATNID
jgi:hypothetical protein